MRAPNILESKEFKMIGMMKTFAILGAVGGSAMLAQPAHADNVRVGFGVSVPARTYYTPAPVYYTPAPVVTYAAPTYYPAAPTYYSAPSYYPPTVVYAPAP